MKLIDLTNQTFGRLTVLYRVYPNNLTKKHTYWKCRCECGKETITSSNHLKTGHTQSCGCLHDEKMGDKNPAYKHGMRDTRLYRIWSGMKERCLNENCHKFKNYGARGIKICNEWLDKENGFINFYDWAINNGYEEDLTIDRFDVNKNYEPNNCRWLSKKEQNLNKTTTRYAVYKHKKKTIMDWAEEYNIKYSILIRRIDRGWDIERALLTPVRYCTKL